MGTLAASTAVYDTATGAGAGGATMGVAGGEGAGSAAASAAGARAACLLGTATAPTGSSGWMSGACASIFSRAALCGR